MSGIEFNSSRCVPIQLSASASMMSGRCSLLSSSAIPREVSSAVPSPGPMAMASYFVVCGGWVKCVADLSSLMMASGMLLCRIGVLYVGVCTVNNPTPERNAALVDSMAAPAMLRFPAMRRPCPNVPLCPSYGREWMYFATSLKVAIWHRSQSIGQP